MADIPSETVFAVCARQRYELADLLEGLTDVELETPSLCSAWTVRMVAAHLAGAITGSMRTFMVSVLRHGGNLHGANDALARRKAAEPISSLVSTLRDRADSRLSPPVTGPRGPLADLLVHGGDIRLPLSLAFTPPLDATEIALDFLTGRAPGFVPRRRLSGIMLAPTDTDRRWGSGSEITGCAGDLMMAVSGRPATLDRLAGPGLPILRSRISPTGSTN